VSSASPSQHERGFQQILRAGWRLPRLADQPVALAPGPEPEREPAVLVQFEPSELVGCDRLYYSVGTVRNGCAGALARVCFLAGLACGRALPALSPLALVSCRNWDDQDACEPLVRSAKPTIAGCVRFDAPIEVGRVQDAQLVEVSGLQASRAHPGVLYAHNDSGDRARFFALDASGKTLGEYTLPGANATDWEDVGIGPGRSSGDDLYFADIGDNSLVDSTVMPRDEIQIVRVREPDVATTQVRVEESLNDWQRIRLQYPDRHHDAEALLVDPDGSELWILTKETDGRSQIFGAPTAPSETPVVLNRVGELWLGGCTTSPRVTAANVSADGTRVLVRTYQGVLLWERPPGTSLPEALSSPPWLLVGPNEVQGEGITFSADGSAWFTIGEGSNSSIFRASASCH
jgi:hypothetical protein